MVGPLQKLADFAKTSIIAIIVAGAVIIVLIMTINTRGRKYEVGILRALGANRFKVAAQFAAEAFIICIIALVIGGTIGDITSQSIASYMLKQQVATNRMNRARAARRA